MTLRVRALVRQTCEAFEIRIVKGVVGADHIHILVSAPPEMAPSEIMRRIKVANCEPFVRGVCAHEEAVLGKSVPSSKDLGHGPGRRQDAAVHEHRYTPSSDPPGAAAIGLPHDCTFTRSPACKLPEMFAHEEFDLIAIERRT